MTERFSWLVERLYRANLRMASGQTDAERQSARAWLRLWNRALQREHTRAHRQRGTDNNGGKPLDA
jgi:hypothetical protein